MEEIALNVQVRKESGTRKVRRVRLKDAVPGIIYGGKKEETLIQIDRRYFEHIRRLNQGQGVIFHLNVLEGEEKVKDYTAMIAEEQHHPVNESLIHIDFKRISLKEKITIEVPLVAKGEAPGVVKDGGSLEHVIWDLEVECLPTQIPKKIEIDISKMIIGDSIHVKDLVMPEGVVTKHDPESIVLTVVPPMKEEVVQPEVAAEAAEPEVIKKEKKAEEEEAAEEPKKKE